MNMSFIEKHVLMSIKPEYANKIMSGEKHVELRRFFPQDVAEKSVMFIYSSSPEKAIIGYVRIKKVQKLPIMEIWKLYGKDACIEYKKFRAYFAGKKEGYALILTEPKKFNKAIEREKMQEQHRFSPPQSYKYLTKELYELIYESTNISA